MIAWLLRELEKNPTSVFRKRDLLKISERQFEELRRLGFLTYVQPDLNSDTYPCSQPCDKTCPMDIAEVEGKLFAICPNDSELDPISLDRDDLDKYTFCVEKFLEHVRTANKLDGTLHKIDQDYLYFGSEIYTGRRLGFVFGFTVPRKSVLELTGLKRLCADDDFLVVFSPVSMIEDVLLKGRLHHDKIIQTSLASSLNFQTYELSIEKILSGAVAREAAETGQKNNGKKKLTPPKGYTGTNTVVSLTIAELKERLNLPPQKGDESHKLPRSVLAYRAGRDKKTGGLLDAVTIKRNPASHEIWYPNSWLKTVVQDYKPRGWKL